MSYNSKDRHSSLNNTTERPESFAYLKYILSEKVVIFERLTTELRIII